MSGADPTPEPWMVACGKEIAATDEWMYDLAVSFANVRREPPPVPLDKGDGRPTGVPARDPAYISEIVDCIKKWVPAAKPEDQPVTRGDVVQVVPELWEGRVRPRLWIVLDIDEHGYAKTGGSPDVPLSRCVRIGRARYYPDGSPVEPT